MLLKIQLILVSLVTADASESHTARPVVIKLDRQQVIDALTSEGSLKYIEKLAKIFASKAAEHFIEQVRSKKRATDKGHNLEEVKQYQDRSEKKVLEESEALLLLNKPPPDGDNLSVASGELLLTDDERKEKEKVLPVVGLTKVNGRYFYRRYYMRPV